MAVFFTPPPPSPQERTVVDADSAESWYDYGCFCARMGDFAKADECLREAISIQQDHIPSLLMAAIVSWRNSRANLVCCGRTLRIVAQKPHW